MILVVCVPPQPFTRGLERRTKPECEMDRARDLNLHLDPTYAWIQPIPGFEAVDVCDGILPPLPPFVRHPGLGPVFTRPSDLDNQG